jgi:hypothetical protein
LRGPQKILREKDEVRIKATQEATMKRQQVFDVAAVRGIIAERKDMAGAMLPILHGIQDKVGYIPADAVPMIASELNVSRAEVHGVISFYHFFRQEPAGRTWCRSAAPRPARRAAAKPWPNMRRTCWAAASMRPAPMAVHAGTGVLPGPVRHRPQPDHRMTSCTPASMPTSSSA